MLGKEKLCNVDNLLLWAVNKQMRCEGGFQVGSLVFYLNEEVIPSSLKIAISVKRIVGDIFVFVYI